MLKILNEEVVALVGGNEQKEEYANSLYRNQTPIFLSPILSHFANFTNKKSIQVILIK
jgi:hypothetical protein